MKKKMTLLAILAMCFVLTTTAYAIPKLISYQGVLNDSSGNPVDDTVEMTFRIYDASTGGNLLWNETQNVSVSDGIFNVELGAIQAIPASALLSDTLYLSIQAGTDAEMTPRQRITAGAYVQTAVPIGSIMPWAKNISGVPDLAEGWIECNGQVLSDPDSPLNGQTIPNLNGQNRFLRGNATSGSTGGTANHKHELPFLGANMSSVIYKHGGIGAFGEGSSYSGSVYSNFENSILTTNKNWILSNTPYQAGVTDPGLPPYYSVVWIMRVK
jgi:hypothetical protein